MSVAEQTDMLAQRLDVLLVEADRIESALLVEGNVNLARDLQCFAVDLRLARRTLASIVRTINPPTPLRTLALVGRIDRLTAPRAGPSA